MVGIYIVGVFRASASEERDETVQQARMKQRKGQRRINSRGWSQA
jgi:hypothetical protein